MCGFSICWTIRRFHKRIHFLRYSHCFFLSLSLIFFSSRGLSILVCDKLNPRFVCKNIVIYRCEVRKSNISMECSERELDVNRRREGMRHWDDDNTQWLSVWFTSEIAKLQLYNRPYGRSPQLNVSLVQIRIVRFFISSAVCLCVLRLYVLKTCTLYSPLVLACAGVGWLFKTSDPQ